MSLLPHLLCVCCRRFYPLSMHANSLIRQCCCCCCCFACTPPFQAPGDIRVRACAFSTDTGLGTFATFPLAKHISGGRGRGRVDIGMGEGGGVRCSSMCMSG
jgi:hypothetical protein